MAKKIRWHKVYDFSRHGIKPQEALSVRTIDIDGRRYALAYNGTEWHAFDDRCPHAHGRFGAGGWCDEFVMVCPVHRHHFNLENGRGHMGDYVEKHHAEQREDGVYIGIEVSSHWWWPFG